MSNRLKRELENIEIPSELHDRAVNGVNRAKWEKRKNNKSQLSWLAIPALIAVSAGAYAIYNNTTDKSNAVVVNLMEDLSHIEERISFDQSSITIPAIKLPSNSQNADMIGLIVYKGKIYTQTSTKFIGNSPDALRGEKLGRTKGSIDEWSKQGDYASEFASSIGKSDVYTVKGYDESFRIMTYNENGGALDTEIYENLNDRTISSGRDIFDLLKIEGNIKKVQYQTYDDWNNSTGNKQDLKDIKVLEELVSNFNTAIPLVRESSGVTETTRFLDFTLNDGTSVQILLDKEGHINYGQINVDFKIQDMQAFKKVWRLME
ncbi:hypothetical protein ACQKMD_00830 [Viridibacillus sp. NPDC096237]|uniref:hypothetical protein n=1 Tax=Viridibacillus sp. NPDC096237 TaxID=3390721 RepID=UPI003D067DDA